MEGLPGAGGSISPTVRCSMAMRGTNLRAFILKRAKSLTGDVMQIGDTTQGRAIAKSGGLRETFVKRAIQLAKMMGKT
jgi:hypothetical protein